MSAAVIAGCNAPPVFEAPKHIFNFVSFFVESFIERDVGFSVFLWRNARFNAFVTQRVSEPVGIITVTLLTRINRS